MAPVCTSSSQCGSVFDNRKYSGTADQVVGEGDAGATVHFGALVILTVLELTVAIDEGFDIAFKHLALTYGHQLHAGVVAANLLNQLLLFAETIREYDDL